MIGQVGSGDTEALKGDAECASQSRIGGSSAAEPVQPRNHDRRVYGVGGPERPDLELEHVVPLLDSSRLQEFGDVRANAPVLECVRDRKSTRLNSSHERLSRMPSSA